MSGPQIQHLRVNLCHFSCQITTSAERQVDLLWMSKKQGSQSDNQSCNDDRERKAGEERGGIIGL